ncbi:hypothetical protein ES332_D02G094500v1 [Gossypium tomentosum]|uniref:Uncharacterized protein n=1 Tax=Gossypium tomentosum TaxID=34277 RepID=A0A5D2LV24_GOSTO|nr:hypothetical protein ES332_D02G094500v1 [Gossypium tomentosum]
MKLRFSSELAPPSQKVRLQVKTWRHTWRRRRAWGCRLATIGGGSC